MNFYKWGNHFQELAATVAADLQNTPYKPIPTINKRKNGNSGLMIVASTPIINNTSSFDEQRSKIIEGILIVEELRKWVCNNKTVIEKWANLIKE